MAETKHTYPVRGMTCAACARNVENILKFTEGVSDASVNYAAHQVQVSLEQDVDFGTLQKTVQSIGYDLVEKADHNKQKEEEKKNLLQLRNKLIVAVLFSTPVFLLSMVFTGVKGAAYIQLLLSLPVIFYSGRHYYVSAVKKLKHWQFNMDTLIAMGTGAAFLYSLFATLFSNWFVEAGIETHVYFESAVVIITLILLGKFLEERAKMATSGAIDKLMELQPSKALRISGNTEEEVPIDALMVGDCIKILPGSNIPVDGIVKSGSSYVNQSMLTGESEAIKKSFGDMLIGGTMNQAGALEMEVTKVGENTVLAGIIRMVQEAQGSKAPAQKLADKVSSIFVPAVIIIALVSGLLWYFLGPEPAGLRAFVVAVTVLIIACPCALGLATPTAITVSVGKGAQQGILIKDAETFEQMKKVNTLLIDKTGTLTKGEPEVIRKFFREEKPSFVGALLAAEKQSEHPAAKSLVKWLEEEVKPAQIESFEVESGSGISFSYEGIQYYAGRAGWQHSTHDTWYNEHLTLLEEAKATIVEVSSKGETIALFGLSDPIKKEAKAAVKAIQTKDIAVYMLTGDRKQIAAHITKELGLDGFEAELLPEQKLNVVKKHQANGEIVAMVGDGINDAPALAQANVSIAMGTGTDAAMASAGITLLHGDISKIEKAISLSQKTATIIKQNLFWAFFYNVLAIPIAAGALYPFTGYLLDPMIAGGAMAFSSVTVVFNSLRLKWSNI